MVSVTGGLQVGDHLLNDVELYEFSDGIFLWDGTQFQVAESSGSVTDGYLAGATVYIDVDRDYVLDPGEPWTTTDANGDFELVSHLTGPLRAFGGTNIDTGLANDLVLSAPEGSNTVNPITTMINSLVESGDENGTPVTVEEAEALVEEAFGIDPSLDLTQVDLIEAAETDPAALDAQKTAAAIAEVLDAVADADGDVDGALDSLTTIVESGETVDLTDTTTLETVISSGGVSGEELEDLVEETQALTETIEEAEDLDDISNAQASNFATVDEDAVVSGNLLDYDLPGGLNTDDPAELSIAQVGGIDVVGETILQGQYGTLSVNPDGSFSYYADADILDALPPGEELTESFAYQVVDQEGGSGNATLAVQVTTIDDQLATDAGNGSDTVDGAGDDEVISGGNGSDELSGGDGSDRIDGGSGRDILLGDAGIDILAGGSGDDVLDGGSEMDILIGGKGDDSLTGGGGPDIFVYNVENGSSGADNITDFVVGEDTLYLALGLTVDGISESAGGSTLTLSDFSTIFLDGVTGLGGDFTSLLIPELPEWFG